jgi:ABC-type multidrug transport system ATPase subunit
MSESRHVVRIRSATVLLDRFPALAKVDFDAFEAEVVFIKGPNGSGKTTLLRLVAGLVKASRGEVLVFGRDPATDASAIRAAVSYLSHSYQMYDELSAEENLDFFARISGFSLVEATELANRFGLGKRELSSRFQKLSAGQRKKISIAVALARASELLLLDEPHALLDLESKTVLDKMLIELARAGRTIVVASHELDRADGLANREYQMVSGTAKLVRR